MGVELSSAKTTFPIQMLSTQDFASNFKIASKTIPFTIPFVITVDESFDVGMDTRSGVDDNDYRPPFRFNGKLEKLTIKLIPPERTAAEEELLNQKTQESVNATQ
jgi:hypothetical protein